MANKQYLIELAVKDGKLKSSLKKALENPEIQKQLGILGEGITEHLEKDVNKAASILGKVDWASLLGTKDFEHLQQVVAKTVSANKDLIKSFIKANDVKGIQDTIELVSALGSELKAINPDKTVAGLARSMTSFMKVVTPLTGQLDALADAPEKIATAFGGMASSIDKSITSAYNRAGKTLEKMQNDVLKHLRTQLDASGESIIKYQIDDKELNAYISKFEDAKSVAEELNKEIENSQAALRKLSNANTRDAGTMLSLVKYEQKINALMAKLSTLQPSVNGNVITKDLDATVKQITDKLEKSFNKTIEDKLSSIKVEIDVPTEEKLIEDLNKVIEKVNEKGTSSFKLTGAESAIKEAQNKILANTQEWHNKMKEALKFNKKEDIELDLGVKLRDIGSDVGGDLKRSIEEYFDNPANKVAIPVELILTGENKAVIEGGGGNITINGGVGGGEITAESLAKALTTPIEVKVQEEQQKQKSSGKLISLNPGEAFSNEVIEVFDQIFEAIERGGENAKKISEFFRLKGLELSTLKGKGEMDILSAFESFLERGDKSVLDDVDTGLAKGSTKNKATLAFRDLLRDSIFRFDLDNITTKEDVKRRQVRALVEEDYIPKSIAQESLYKIRNTDAKDYKLPTVEELNVLMTTLPNTWGKLGEDFLPALESLKQLRSTITDPTNATEIKRFQEASDEFALNTNSLYREMSDFMHGYKIGVFNKGHNKHNNYFDYSVNGGVFSGSKLASNLDKVDYFELYDDPSGHFSRGNRKDAMDNASSLDRYQLRRDSRNAFYRSREPERTSVLAEDIEVTKFEPKQKVDVELQEINKTKEAAKKRAKAIEEVRKVSVEEEKRIEELRKQELSTDKKRRTALKSQRTKNANKLKEAESSGLNDEVTALRTKNEQLDKEITELDEKITQNSVEPTKSPTVLQQLKELPKANEVQSMIDEVNSIDAKIDEAQKKAAELEKFVNENLKAEKKANVGYTKSETNNQNKNTIQNNRLTTLGQILDEKDRTKLTSLTDLTKKDKDVAAKLLNDRKLYQLINGDGGLGLPMNSLLEDIAKERIQIYQDGLNKIDEFLLKHQGQTFKYIQDDSDWLDFTGLSRLNGLQNKRYALEEKKKRNKNQLTDKDLKALSEVNAEIEKDENIRRVLAGTFKGSQEDETAIRTQINEFKTRMVDAGKSYVVDYIDMWSDKNLRELMKRDGVNTRTATDAKGDSILQEFYRRIVDGGISKRDEAYQYLRTESAKYQKNIRKDESALEKIVVSAWEQTEATDTKNQVATDRVKENYKEYVNQWLYTIQENMYNVLFGELDNKDAALKLKKNDELRGLIRSLANEYLKNFGETLLTEDQSRLLKGGELEYTNFLKSDVKSLTSERDTKQTNIEATVQQKAELLRQHRVELLNKISDGTNKGKDTAFFEKALLEVEDELVKYSDQLPYLVREEFEADLLNAKNATEEGWKQFKDNATKRRNEFDSARYTELKGKQTSLLGEIKQKTQNGESTHDLVQQLETINKEIVQYEVNTSRLKDVEFAKFPNDASVAAIRMYNSEMQTLVELQQKRALLEAKGESTVVVDRDISKQKRRLKNRVGSHIEEDKRIAAEYAPANQAAEYIQATDKALYILKEQVDKAEDNLEAARRNLATMQGDEYKNSRIYTNRIDALKNQDVSEYVRSDKYRSDRQKGVEQADKEFSAYLTEKLGEDVAKRIVYEFAQNGDRANIDDVLDGSGNTTRLAENAFANAMTEARKNYMDSDAYKELLAEYKAGREKQIDAELAGEKEKTDAKVQEIWNATKADIERLRNADMANSEELRTAVFAEAEKAGMGNSSEYRRSIVNQVREDLIQQRIEAGRQEQKFYNEQYYTKARQRRSELSPTMYQEIDKKVEQVVYDTVMSKIQSLVGDNADLLKGLEAKRNEIIEANVSGIVEQYRNSLAMTETGMYKGVNVREMIEKELANEVAYYEQKYIESSGKLGMLKNERARAESFGKLGYDETLNPEIAQVRANAEARLSAEKEKQVELTERLTNLTTQNADQKLVQSVAAELQETEKEIARLQLLAEGASEALSLRKTVREEEFEENKWTPEKQRLWYIDAIEREKKKLEGGADDQKAKDNIIKWEQKLANIEKVIEASKPEAEKPKTILDMFTNAIRQGLAGVTAGGTVDLDASMYNIATETTLQEILRLLGGNGAVEYANQLKKELAKDRPRYERRNSEGGNARSGRSSGKKNKVNKDFDKLNADGQRIYGELEAEAKVFTNNLKENGKKYATDFDFVKAIKNQAAVVKKQTKGSLEYIQEQTKLTALYQDYYHKTFGKGRMKKGQPGQSKWAEQGELGKIAGLKDLLLFKSKRANALAGLNYGVSGVEQSEITSTNQKRKRNKQTLKTTNEDKTKSNNEKEIADQTAKAIEQAVANGLPIDADDANELAEMVKAAVAAAMGEGLGRDDETKNQKAHPEYSDAISVGYDRIQKLQKIRESGTTGSTSTGVLLRANHSVWDKVKENNFFNDIPEDGLQRFLKIDEVVSTTVSEILKTLGVTEQQLIQQLQEVRNATGGNFKSNGYDSGWNHFATYNESGKKHPMRKDNGVTYKVYAAFENIEDLNAGIVSSIMKELSDAGFKGRLKTTSGSTSMADKLNAIVNTDQLVVHGASKKDQEIAYNVLKKMGLDLSYLSGGIDTPDGSFTQTLTSDSIDKYVNIKKKEIPVEPEIKSGAVAEEVKENVKQTPPIAEVKPEIKTDAVAEEVKEKTKRTKSATKTSSNTTSGKVEIVNVSKSDEKLPYDVDPNSLIGRLRNTVGGDTGALAKQATLALVLSELQAINKKVPTIGKAGVKSSAQNLLEEFQKMAAGSAMDGKERVAYFDLVNGVMSPSLSGTSHKISQKLIDTVTQQFGPDKGYRSRVHTHADSDQTWFSKTDLNWFKKGISDEFGVNDIKQEILMTKDTMTVLDMTMVETAENAKKAIDILIGAGQDINNDVIENLANLGVRYQSKDHGTIGAKGFMDLLGVKNYQNDSKQKGVTVDPEAALAGLEGYAKSDADKRNSKYVFNSFDGETLKYQLIDAEGNISKVILAWDELEKKVRVVSDTSTSSVDATVKKIQQYKAEIQSAKKELLLSNGDDAGFVAAEKTVDNLVKKIESGSLSGKTLSDTINELEVARTNLANEGAKLHKLIAQNNKLRSGTAEVKQAITQGARVRSLVGDAISTDEQDGLQLFGVGDDAPKYLRDYVAEYNNLIKTQQQYIKDGSINNVKTQDALKVQTAGVKKLGIEAMAAYKNTQRLQELSAQSESQTYQTPSGKEYNLGGSTSVNPSDVNRGAMLQYAKEVLGADLASVKFNATTGKLTGVLKKNNYVVADMAVEYDKATGKLHLYQEKERESLSGMPGFLNGLKAKSKAIIQYVASMTSIYRVLGELRKGIQYIREIDLALTELKKVTNETEETYKKFLDTASKTAEKVGSTIQKVISSTADWARLGSILAQTNIRPIIQQCIIAKLAFIGKYPVMGNSEDKTKYV